MKGRFGITGHIGYTWKIAIVFIAILLIPVSVLAVNVYFHSIQSKENEAKSALHDLLLQKKNDIEQKLDGYEKIGRQISNNKTLSLYFYDVGMDDYSRVNFIMNYLNPLFEWIKSLSSTGFDLRIFTPNSGVYENEWILHSKELENTEWYKMASKASYNVPLWQPFHERRSFWLGHTGSGNGNNLETSLFIPFLNNYNDLGSTILELYFNADMLFMDSSDLMLKKNGVLMVYDKSGNMVYLSDKYGNTLINNKVVESIALKDFQGDSSLKIGNETYMMSAQDIIRLGCKMVVLSPQSAIMKEAYSMRNVFIIVLVSSFIFLLIVVYLLSKGLTRKIRKLVKAVRYVQEGHLDANVVIEGNDEISELGRDFNIMIYRINKYIENEYESEILHKDALLRSLENQINPHFLFNTLESVKMMAEIKQEKEISDTLTTLGALVRYNISKSSDMVPVSVEIEQVSNYCKLENIILNNRLKFETDVDAQVSGLLTLRLVLQPVVENAIFHGFVDFDGDMHIFIKAFIENETVTVSVKDNGNGIDSERLQGIRNWIYGASDTPLIQLYGNGVGLRNVQKRIQIKFGYEFGLKIESKVGYGTEIKLSFPVVEG